MKENIIELNDVWKIYKLGDVDVMALQGVSLEIKKGEFVSLLGKSGSGKSTCLNLIGCLDYPSKGLISLDGHDIANLNESDLAVIRGKKIGFIFQTFNLIPSLNALENVMLPMVFQGVEESKRQKRAKELLELVDMAHRLDHNPNKLSGGERQRVAIARALVNDPEMILADEPTGNLDSKTGVVVMNILKELNSKHGKTIVMVTHDQQLAGFAKRKIFLKDGKVVK